MTSQETEEFPKYPKIRTLGHRDITELFTTPTDKIEIEEKLDGSNVRCMFTRDNKVIYGSRNKTLNEIGGNWKRCIDYLNEKLKDRENPLPPSPIILFGEAMVSHSTHYDYSSHPPFIGFDILELPSFHFLSYPQKLKVFTELGLETVPLINTIHAKDFRGIQDTDVPMSKYGPVQAEGVVFKNNAKQLYGKYVTAAHRESNRRVTRDHTAHDDNERLVSTFCMNPRIDKIIFRLINEDNMSLDMTLMTKLPMQVWQDIIDEHAQEILTTNWTLDIKGIRRSIGKHCVSVLREVMISNINNDNKDG